jgi:nucleoside-diphosphate-sugar epimerase
MESNASGKGRTAFVTGGTGFLGANLVRELVRLGWTAVVLHRRTSDLRALAGLPVRLVEGDVTDPGSLRRALPEGADAVFHLAASLTLWSARHAEQRRVNVDGTRHVVDAALARGARRLVHTSSVAAYGEHDGVVSEETPSTASRARTNYGRTKWLAEQEVRRGLAAGLDAVIVNPANMMGPFDRGGWSRVFFLLARGALPVLYPGRASWCHVREVVRAEIAAVDRGRRGANYLLGGADASYAEYIGIAAGLLGRPGPARVLPRPALRALAAVATLPSLLTRREPPITPEVAELITRDSLCTSARAEGELGYRPTPLREMMEDSHRWLVAEGLLPAPPATG